MGTIKTTNIETITGSGTLTLGASGETISVPSGATLTVPNGGLSGQNYPAFEAKLSADQIPTGGVITKINCSTEVLDTDGYYDNTTNYRFTPLVAGKYYVYGRARGQSALNSQLDYVQVFIYKNGSSVTSASTYFRNNFGRVATPFASSIINMNGSSDYVELYGFMGVNSGGLDGFLGSGSETLFGAYRIGA